METKPMTNADRIRAMSDEKLAEKASRMSFCSGCPVKDCCGGEPDECAKALLAWLLRAKVESEGET